jgi:hypothetical protein
MSVNQVKLLAILCVAATYLVILLYTNWDTRREKKRLLDKALPPIERKEMHATGDMKIEYSEDGTEWTTVEKSPCHNIERVAQYDGERWITPVESIAIAPGGDIYFGGAFTDYWTTSTTYSYPQNVYDLSTQVAPSVQHRPPPPLKMPCPFCGSRVDPDLDQCPHCNGPQPLERGGD